MSVRSAPAQLQALPGAEALDTGQAGQATFSTRTPETLVRAALAAAPELSHLEVTRASLEDAFLSLTNDQCGSCGGARMTAPLHPGVWPVLGGGLLIVWMLIRRLRFTVGAQPLDVRGRRRLSTRSVLLGVVLLLTLVTPHTLMSYGAGMVGALIGAGLAFWSLHHTRFERDAAGAAVRYVPNVWIGSAVFALFVARLLWRVVPVVLGGQLSNTGANSSSSMPAPSPPAAR